MKIIVAGFSKTGTKSMAAALEQLGYEVYDHLDHYMHYGDEWSRVMSDKSYVPDYYEMYKDVDVIIDSPVYLYWEKIHKAFPDAKVRPV